MGRKIRGVAMVATALAAAATVLWMQGRYEKADRRHALEIVQSYHPKGGTDIPSLLAHRHPERTVEWSSAVENSCFQHIRVHAVVAEPEPVLYAFVVDINGPSIHPANDNGQELIVALDTPLPPASATASAAIPASVAAPASAAPPPSAATPASATTAAPATTP